jgi:hypothetical protein
MPERPCSRLKGAVNCTASEVSTYLQAREEGSLPTSSSAMCPSARSRLTPTASTCSCNGRLMDASPGFPFLATSDTLTATPGVDELTLWQEASPASPGVSPGNGQGRQTRATSGLTPTAYFAKYDPATHSWKTSQISLFTTTLEPYSGTWPAHGMMRSGQCLELTTWVLPTAANGSGYSWPTPVAQEGGQGTCPQARGRKLHIEVQITEQVGGQLSPLWTAWLMGWPPGWTSYEPLATGGYPSAPPSPGDYSMPAWLHLNRRWLDAHT